MMSLLMAPRKEVELAPSDGRRALLVRVEGLQINPVAASVEFGYGFSERIGAPAGESPFPMCTILICTIIHGRNRLNAVMAAPGGWVCAEAVRDY